MKNAIISAQSSSAGKPSDASCVRKFPTTAFLLTFVYFIALVCLLDYQSLWVDEIMQLGATRNGSFEHIDALTQTGVGGVPLGWLPQMASIRIFGYSVVTARLPSALAGAAACFAIFLIARQLQLIFPFVPLILLSMLPLHFRYTLEARPYAQGELLSALATLAFIWLVRQQTVSVAVVYALTLIVGIYSQPFSCFIAAAHLLWAFVFFRHQRRLIYLTGAAIIAMAVSFLPWYLYAAPLWQQTIHSGDYHLQLTWKTPLMLIREISGVGYWGGGILSILAIVGFRKGSMSTPMKWLLVACIFVPVICVLAADAIFSYFLAIRQMIFVLPALMLLAADGLIAIMASNRQNVVIATAILIVFFGVADIRWLRRPRENWELAAQVIQKLQDRYSACTLYASSDSLNYYSFFQPKLENSVCPAGTPADRAMILVISPYTSEEDRAHAQEQVKHKQIITTEDAGMSTIHALR